LKGNNAEAIPYFDKVISLSPKFAYAFNNRGWARMRMGNWEEGLEDVNCSLEIDDSNADAYKNLGLYHMEKGDFVQALEMFEKAKEMDGDTHLIDECLAKVKLLL
jgi:tetratricopeptide (TPR) repeat protein